ncbi:hypothetical protein NSS78_16355 [Bacillus sp. FSL W8-0920]|uniref:hypothetical protein n=1 Tax=Bacillus sp. FSL W8-0920 TaxID=2954636 RepID=UPI003159580E
MREIKTESQTIDLSKKITVEVSLAELIVISASLYECAQDDVEEAIATCDPYNRVADLIAGNIPRTHVLMDNADGILCKYLLLKEDE